MNDFRKYKHIPVITDDFHGAYLLSIEIKDNLITFFFEKWNVNLIFFILPKYLSGRVSQNVASTFLTLVSVKYESYCV